MTRFTPKSIGIGFGVVGAVFFGWLQIAAVSRSTSSTAPISLILVPFLCALGFITFFVFGYCVGFIKAELAKNKKTVSIQTIAAFLTAIFLVGYLAKETVTGFDEMKTVSEVERAENNEKLVKIFNESFLKRDKFVLGAIAQKEAASPELLDKIAHLPDSELYEAMGSYFPVLGKNGKGLAVMRLVVSNPHVSSGTVEYLAAHTQNAYVLGDIASSPKTSVVTLRKLEQEKNYLIDWDLAFNRSTPPDVFAHLLERGKSSTHRITLETLVQNPSASADVKKKAAEILKASY